MDRRVVEIDERTLAIRADVTDAECRRVESRLESAILEIGDQAVVLGRVHHAGEMQVAACA